MLYSLEITPPPPSIISPPLLFVFVAEVYLSPIYAPLDHIYTKNLIIHNNNGSTLWLQRTRGRLELTVLLCIQSSYLLANDTPTKRLAARRQVVWKLFCIFRPLTLCTFIDSWSFTLQNWATMSFIASHTRRQNTTIAVPLWAPQRGKGSSDSR